MKTRVSKESPEESLPARVGRVVGDLDLEETEELVAAVAVALAEAFEEAPLYSRARLASELLGCLDRLQEKVNERKWKTERRSWLAKVEDG